MNYFRSIVPQLIKSRNTNGNLILISHSTFITIQRALGIVQTVVGRWLAAADMRRLVATPGGSKPPPYKACVSALNHGFFRCPTVLLNSNLHSKAASRPPLFVTLFRLKHFLLLDQQLVPLCGLLLSPLEQLLGPLRELQRQRVIPHFAHDEVVVAG